MDYVLWKRYRGKLEHYKVDLYDSLPASHRANCLAVFLAPMAMPLEGSSMTSGERLLDVQMIIMVALPSSAEMVEDFYDVGVANVECCI